VVTCFRLSHFLGQTCIEICTLKFETCGLGHDDARIDGLGLDKRGLGVRHATMALEYICGVLN